MNNEWITDRKPTIEDSTIEGEFVLIKIGPNTVQGAHYTRVGDYPWRSLSNYIAKHTPGPWRWVETRYLMWRKFSLLGNNDYEVLCFGVDDSRTMEMVGEEPSKADAHLIAAAPELLEALKRLLSQFGLQDHLVDYSVGDLAAAAIAKAEGEVMP